MSTEKQRLLLEGPVYAPVSEDESWAFYGVEGPNDVFLEADEDCCCWDRILAGVSFLRNQGNLYRCYIL